jgi:dTDP-4-dehydrorhamnose 3,5-epimerase-like enzyme
MTDKRSQRIIKATTLYNTKPTEADIEDFIQDQVNKDYIGSLRGLNIEVKKEYKIVLE